ncbi:MAG: DEAD/DEAH box helicase [Wenzhouxiangella sp.]|jgi:superfamily II DNA or RNA helicase|nr:DEAD/DEAH box helicase [Wenzhouxiangella sp.]
MNRAASRRLRPSHKVLYLFHLSADGQLSLNPVRAPLAGVIGEISPLPLSLIEQETSPPYLTEADFDILHELAERCELLPGLTWYPLPASAQTLFVKVVETGRARWEDPDGADLHVADPITAKLFWRLLADGSQALRFNLAESAEAMNWRHLPLLPPWIIDTRSGACRPVRAVAGAEELVIDLLALGRIDPSAVGPLRERIRRSESGIPEPQALKVEYLPLQRPCVNLCLRNVDVGSSGRFLRLPAVCLAFGYGELQLDWDAEGNSRLLSDAADGQPRRVLSAARDHDYEDACLSRLEGLGLVPLSSLTGLDYPPGEGGLLVLAGRERMTEAWAHAQRGLQELQGQGWRVRREADLVGELLFARAWTCRLGRAEGQTIQLDLEIEVDGQHLSVLAGIASWAQQATPMLVKSVVDGPDSGPDILVAVDERRLVSVSRARLKAVLEALVELSDPQLRLGPGPMRVRRGRLADLAGLGQQWTLTGDAHLAKVARRLDQLTLVEPMAEPVGLRAVLREYQRRGLGWLQFLREAGFGGILADDMGLGKTVQSLAHILVEKRAGRLDRPALVVAPTSLMFNWRSEAHRFAPDLKVLLLHGPRRRGEIQWIADSDLVLTTYPLLARDIDWLERERWHLVILDEAQSVKNPRTRAARAVRRLETRHRLCLTGTPMENHLGELWSQFDFLMPGLLGTERAFRSQFRQPIEKLGNGERRHLLARRIRPFFLRRTKAEVAPELPAKTEIVRSVPLTGSQYRLYQSLREEMTERVRLAIQAQGADRGRMVILDALLRLRQACCDPRLLDSSSDRSSRTTPPESAKLELLMDLLPEMVIEGRRILLFSQFVRMLELIEQELVRRGIAFVKLTGRTRDRQKVIEAFQRGDAPVFLISLRAGGVGLNLTAADTVIHYDPWWNPAVEDQATDRAHRIGQDRKVFVYRLLTEGTIEERVQRLQASKRELIDGLLSGGGAMDLGAEELELLLGSG